MCEALDEHEDSVSIGGRPATNFRFVVNAEEEEEADVLAGRLDTTWRSVQTRRKR